MENANVRIVKEVYGAFKRRDIPAVLEALAPDASWSMVGREQDIPIAGMRHGRDGAAGFFRTMSATVEIHSFEPREFLGADDRVFCWGHWRWTMRDSGVSGENEWLHVFTFRDGKIVSWRGHNDTAQLAAAYRATPAKQGADVRALLERLLAAFNRGDIPYILDHVSEDCALRGTLAPELPWSGVFHGVAGAAKYFEGIALALEPSALVVDRYVCEGEEIVAVARWSGVARASRQAFDTPLALYFRFRDGKMVDFRGHEDTAVTLGAIRG